MPNLGVAVVRQYERGVVFRLGRLRGVREPGLRWMIPLVDRMRKVSLRTVTMPIPSQQVITRDNVSIGVAAVAYFRRVDPVASIVQIENVQAAIDQIAQTTVRNVVGRSALDRVLSDTETINEAIKEILDQGDPRRHHQEVGRAGRTGRAQGHPAARLHATGDGARGRG